MDAETKKISDLTAEELYALAREREQQEAERREASRKKKLEALRKKRKEIVARQRAELAELDREIRDLGGRAQKARAAGGRRGGTAASGTISQKLCDIVATKPEMMVSEIREQAEAAGIDTKNISQTLAYLKRQGRLDSPRRGVYSAP
ncbi:hypothetical protein [Thioalkalivibrio paradoxus]|uniref:Uncharacterized protein n=1 Tax=Thioalkalivibrio paradoxus ARh 1 TaxID=713585 RepID=W0DJA6_9GAMM|nr:hypothetical protein [Thioalkalivibrio paradoxus]AHE97322.1 hypothetical protein THITH_02460 [Thioalkalivibrio paradoxus ARh 1]